jgi:hypothetical protein
MTPWRWRSKRKFSVGVHRRRQTVVGALRFDRPPAIAWGAVGSWDGVVGLPLTRKWLTKRANAAPDPFLPVATVC